MKRALLLLTWVLAIGLQSSGAQALDPSDSEPPKLVSIKTISNATSSLQPIVLEVKTTDDKNWVEVMPDSYYRFLGAKLPACATYGLTLDVSVIEASRVTLADGRKAQTFLMTFFTPPPSPLPAGCPEHQIASNLKLFFGTMQCDPESCIALKDQAGFRSYTYVDITAMTSSQFYISRLSRQFCFVYPRAWIPESQDLSKLEAKGLDAVDVLIKIDQLVPLKNIQVDFRSAFDYLGLVKQGLDDLQPLKAFYANPSLSTIANLSVCEEGSNRSFTNILNSWNEPGTIDGSYFQDRAVGFRQMLGKALAAKAAVAEKAAAEKAAAEKVAADKAIAEEKARAEAAAAAKALAEAATRAKASSIRKTITCVKGKAIKKVSGTNPICPSGYKQRK